MTSEQAAFLTGQMVGLMQGEFPNTCKVLAAVKDDSRDYKPDAKSRSAWDLARHIATADIWFIDSIINGKFEFDPEGAKKAEAQFNSIDEVVAFYKKTMPGKFAALKALPGDKLAREVDFFGMMKMPAAGFIGLANNHSVHHRGQLASYLRAMGSKVPAIYGGSADEPMAGM
jgi:uncharacterized damage-inducible protein DinB